MIRSGHSGRSLLIYPLIEFPCCQHKKCFARLTCAPPFDLIETDLNVEWIYIVLVLITDKFLVNYIRILQFMAIFYI